MKLTFKLPVIAIILLVMLFITSCKKEVNQVMPENPKMENLQISQDFDWKTTKDFQLTITGNADGLVEVTNADGISYQKVFLSASEPYTFKLTVPSYENSVRLKFMGQDIKLELSANELSYQF